MKNSAKISFNLLGFEPITETSENKMIGGFSDSVNGKIDSLNTLSNNCMGGNCTKGCGDWPTNDSCNSVAGCGVIQQ
ncbi:hypothetical protein [Lacinutrix chionoecetis]